MSLDHGEGEQELGLRRECETLITTYMSQLLSERAARGPAFTPKGSGYSKSKKQEAPVHVTSRQEENGSAMGRESSVDLHEWELARVVNSIAREEMPMPNGIPSSLPERLREQPMSVEERDVIQLYNPARTLQKLPRQEVLALYFRSFANILTYDVTVADALKRRFTGFLAAVLVNLVKMCYPNIRDSEVEKIIIRDLRQYLEAQRSQSS